jgi:hypothetical protein
MAAATQDEVRAYVQAMAAELSELCVAAGLPELASPFERAVELAAGETIDVALEGGRRPN